MLCVVVQHNCHSRVEFNIPLAVVTVISTLFQHLETKIGKLTDQDRPLVAFLESGLCSQLNVAEQNRAGVGGHHISRFH